VFCDEIAADPSFRRRPSWTVDEANPSPPIIHTPSATGDESSGLAVADLCDGVLSELFVGPM
jgi:hypothetical protein